MKQVFVVLFSLLSLGLGFTSCKDDKTDEPQKYGSVKVIHASFDAPNVDVYVDGSKALSDVPFKTASNYTQLMVGSRAVKITASNSTSAVKEANLAIEEGKSYSVFAVGSIAAGSSNPINFLTTVDDLTAPATGKAHVRVAHVADAPAVDVVVLNADTTVALTLYSSVGTNSVTAFTPLDAGTYKVGVRAAGSGNPVLAFQDFTLAAGKIYTVSAMGRLAGTPGFEFVTIVNK